jgi:hypothetical protein
MPLVAEVNVLKAEVRRHQYFVAARQPQHGAVIADSRASAPATSPGSAANAINQRLFLQGHGYPPGRRNLNIYKWYPEQQREK